MTAWHDLPYGVDDVDPLQARPLKPDHVRCCIKGCSRILERAHRQTRRDPACFCPDHGIRVSASTTSPTYVYEDPSRNFIVDRHLLDDVDKTVRWRLPNETSEDALSWNVFVGLRRLERLREVVRTFTGTTVDREPELYLWSSKIGVNGVNRWAAICEVRKALEESHNIQTEPDVTIRVPGEVLILVEAKFGSANCTLASKDYASVDEFLDVYEAPVGSDPLDRAWIGSQQEGRVLEQLCRHAVFGAWLREPGERVVLINLLRRCELIAKPPEFAPHLNPAGPVEFSARSWEDLFPLCECPGGDLLIQYFRGKSYHLRPAFDLTKP